MQASIATYIYSRIEGKVIMERNDITEIGKQTDYEVLQNYFGEEYFVLQQITKNKIVLSPQQIQFLETLIGDRNHYDIVEFVNKLRN